jgi:hypothetical protein
MLESAAILEARHEFPLLDETLRRENGSQVAPQTALRSQGKVPTCLPQRIRFSLGALVFRKRSISCEKWILFLDP